MIPKLTRYADPLLDRQIESLCRAVPAQYGTGAPLNTPRYIGDTYIDTTGGTVYTATTMDNTGWVVCSGGNIGGGSASSVTFTASGNIAATNAQAAIEELDSEKQATLVSATNIKTVNGSTLLGSGDLVVVHDMMSSLTVAENSITGAATAVANRWNVCSGTSADYTVTLPTPSAGLIIGLRMASGLTKLVTVDAGSGKTVNGVDRTKVMWASESVILIGIDANTWAALSYNARPSLFNVYRGSDQTPTISAYTKITSLADGGTSGRISFDSGNNRININAPVKMWVQARVGMKTLTPSNNIYYAAIFKNNNWYNADGDFYPSGTTNGNGPNVLSLMTMVAGDFIDFRGYTDDTGVVFDSGGGSATAITMFGSEVCSW